MRQSCKHDCLNFFQSKDNSNIQTLIKSLYSFIAPYWCIPNRLWGNLVHLYLILEIPVIVNPMFLL